MRHTVQSKQVEHWFDRATKYIARNGISRRSVLQGAGLAGASALVAGSPVGAWSVAGQGPCTRRAGSSGSELTFGAQSTYQGKTLTLSGVHSSRGRKHPSGRTQVKVELGGALVMTIDHSATQSGTSKGRGKPVLQGTVTYGSAFSGVRHVASVARNGAVTGFVDGRAFSGTSGQSAGHMRDGKPAPAPHVDPALAHAIQSLFVSAGNNVAQCAAKHASAVEMKVATTRSQLLAQPLRELARRVNSPVDVAQTFPSGPCADCYNLCDDKMIACQVKAFASCASIGPFCLIPIGICIDAWNNCSSACFKTSGPCCSVKCHPVNIGESTCCGTGDTCCGDACCGDGTPVCSHPTSEGANYGFCCPSGSVGCLGNSGGYWYENCCPKGTTCCGGTLCCASGQYCASGPLAVCCPTGQSLCGGQCCSGRCQKDSAGNEFCCTGASVCGSTCCGPNEKCLTTSSGAKICCNGSLCGGKCCGPGAICHNGQCAYGKPCGNTFCGLTNPVCCNGVCCASNQTCVGGKCTGAKCTGHKVPCPSTPGLCCPPKAACCGKQCCKPGIPCCGGICTTNQCSQ